MKVQVTKKLEQGAVPVFLIKEGERASRHPLFSLLPPGDGDFLRLFEKKLASRGEFTKTVLLPSGRCVILLGIARKRSDFGVRHALLAARRAVGAARAERAQRIEVAIADFMPQGGETDEETAEAVATQFEMANFEFTKYKTPPDQGWHFVKEIFVFALGKRNITAAVRRGKLIGEEVNGARVLANTPGGDMTPRTLAGAARRAGSAAGFRVKVLEEKAIRRLKMGGVLGVGRGSAEKPRFIVMEYMKGKKSEKPVVLVGKGVTFDTGGLNLKPEQGISEMHMDMSGGAAVIHVVAALARLGVKRNIVGLVPAVENMPSGSSYHPGDLLRTMSGKTIEVLNTDAEGRVILADALTYAKRYDPRLVIDVATLTGAAEVALGQRASAIFVTDTKLEGKLREAGEEVGDFVWPLPLWEEYEEEVKGTFGDVANVGKTRYGGAITGAVFLWQFIKEYPWVHIDIAPRMTAIENEYLAKGAAGASIALLVRFLRHYN